MAADANKHQLNATTHQDIFERRIKPQLFASVEPVGTPVAVVFGGQPGAGKSAAVDAAIQELRKRGGAAQIIGDDLRGYHPKYGLLMEQDDKTAAFYTDRDTGRWVEKAIEYATQQRLNIVIEGTMRDSNKVAQTMESLRKAGYEIDARVLAVNELLSWQGVIQRYENQKADRGYGRMTAPQSHQAAYDGLLLTVQKIEQEKLADRLTVYRRGGKRIYENSLVNQEWQHKANAQATIEHERRRPWSLTERKEYAEAFDKLAVLISKPERGATAEELKRFEALRTNAKRYLDAELFRAMEKAEAIKSSPALAGAYDVVAALAERVHKENLTEKEKTILMARVHENVALSIERGFTPAIQNQSEVNLSKGRDIER